MKNANQLTKHISYNYIYIDMLYDKNNISITDIINNKDKYINDSLNLLDRFKFKNDQYIIITNESSKYPDMLNQKRCIVGLKYKNQNNTDKLIHVIWFENNNISIEESLQNIIRTINWDTLT